LDGTMMGRRPAAASRRQRTAGAALAVVLGLALAGPAQAQFSAGYRFLEAVRKRDGDAVTKALSEPGTQLANTRDATSGDSALHIVTQRRDAVWVRFLKDQGANVNARNDKGETPLVVASNLGWGEGVELLVSLGARVDEPNRTGETPLIAATHRRDAAIARALLKAGADPRRNDNSGRSALDYAELDGRANPVLAEIEAAQKNRATAKVARPTYGPGF
jgi:ankyrin repeat protein